MILHLQEIQWTGTMGAAQLEESWLAWTKPLSPAPHTPWMLTNPSNPNTVGVQTGISEGQEYPQLHIESRLALTGVLDSWCVSPSAVVMLRSVWQSQSCLKLGGFTAFYSVKGCPSNHILLVCSLQDAFLILFTSYHLANSDLGPQSL